MNFAEFFDRVRSRRIVFALITLAVFGIGLFFSIRRKDGGSEVPLFLNTNSDPPTTVVRELVPVRPVQQPQLPIEKVVVKPLTPLTLHFDLPPETNPPTLGKFAPAGRLIRAVTVNSIESANTETPIIALVTDSLWFDGEEIIPVGTELHGRVGLGKLRDRVVASGTWTIVWQNGEELTVDGIALDRDDKGNGGWGDRDGSAGLSGTISKNDESAEVKLFISTLMSGAAGGFQKTQSSPFGNLLVGNARNAALSGGSAVMNDYAQRVADTIQKEGVFVKVPSGKQMYLYVTHTLDRSQAKIGSLKVGPAATPFEHHAAK